MLQKNLLRLCIILGVLSWASVLLIEFLRLDTSLIIPDSITKTCLSIYYLVVFFYFRINIATRKSSNFNEYLWEVFVIGGSTIIVSLFIKFFFYIFDYEMYTSNVLLVNVLYHVNLGLMVILLANGFYVWKRMILYQKSKLTNTCWNVFEVLVYMSILTNFIPFNSIDLKKFALFAFPVTGLGLFLSFNLKWVAFLNYKQKWQSIAFIILIIFICGTFFKEIFDQRLNSNLLINVADNAFIFANLGFLLLNCIASMLVLLFHLPTSSVFEKKFGEVMIFQKLSQTIHMGDKETDVHKMLLESSITTVLADAGWLEIVNEKGNYEAFLNRHINEFDVFEIKKVLRKNSISIDVDPHYIKNIKSYNHTERIKGLSLKSILIVPLMSNSQRLGTMVLLKNLEDGFDKEMVDIIFSFVSQASLAIRNFRLVNDAIENERYKEELKIAKEVQKSLFPESLVLNINLEINAFTKAADEVGGDYYDVFEYSDNQVVIVIGDVSGNGTSAAFNMAQMKGVFQSLVQLGLPADNFMNYANNALSRCLEKTSFITLSLFIIDISSQSFQFARAGHCPALYYSALNNDVFYLQSKGLGLGIIRNKDYLKHIQKKEYQYTKGDIMVLYTDGIVEAHNTENEEFGFERLKNVLAGNYHLNPKQISDIIVNELYNFTGTRYLSDDYSFLVIKFL